MSADGYGDGVAEGSRRDSLLICFVQYRCLEAKLLWACSNFFRHIRILTQYIAILFINFVIIGLCSNFMFPLQLGVFHGLSSFCYFTSAGQGWGWF